MRFLFNGQSAPPLTRAAEWAKVFGLDEEAVIDAIAISHVQRAREDAARRRSRGGRLAKV